LYVYVLAICSHSSYQYSVKLYCLLSALALLTASATAQNKEQGYILTSAGDTLRGNVLFVGPNQQTLRLRRPNQAPADFNATQAASYGDATGALWESRLIGPNGTARFVAPLVRGPVSLYSGKNEAGSQRFFLQPADSAYVVEVPPDRARLAYLRLLPGCADFDFAFSKFEQQYPYTYSGMTRLVKDYNACRYPQKTTKLVATPGGTRTQFGLKGGVHATRFNFPGISLIGTQKMQGSYHGGAFVLIRTKTRFAVQIEAMYMAFRGEYGPSNYYNGNATYTTTRTIAVRYSQLQVPVLFRYTIGSGSFSPYINAGPLYGFNFNQKSEDVYQDSNKPSPTRLPVKISGSNSVGGTAGVGMLVRQRSLPLLNVEARFDYRIDSSGLYDSTPTHTSLRLDVGVLF
jgi:hypothetical protein